MGDSVDDTNPRFVGCDDGFRDGCVDGTSVGSDDGCNGDLLGCDDGILLG